MASSISPLSLNTSAAQIERGRVNVRVATATTPQEKVDLRGESPSAPLTYSNPKNPRIVPPDLETLLTESARKVDEMLNLIRPLVEQQGLQMNLVASGQQRLQVDQDTIDAAKAAIGEDGEFGVRKVAERILSFAKFAMGDDPAQLDKIEAAVADGFAAAKQALGGTLPEISEQTFQTIKDEFARWRSEGIPAGDTVSLPRASSDTPASTSPNTIQTKA
ncbi:hypothetical protein [Chitinibacter sp. ZOR0017]|uniref:hypothetical protein n=1 Tax=Chitinibacter sp. ZOR0017 TaxID=1339254 RepID=UPI0012E08FCC|nr:hypothetical protein [Chitinibacter sp. ZOR0017]